MEHHLLAFLPRRCKIKISTRWLCLDFGEKISCFLTQQETATLHCRSPRSCNNGSTALTKPSPSEMWKPQTQQWEDIIYLCLQPTIFCQHRNPTPRSMPKSVKTRKQMKIANAFSQRCPFFDSWVKYTAIHCEEWAHWHSPQKTPLHPRRLCKATEWQRSVARNRPDS